MIAICNIRMQPHYRRDAFTAGLKRVGYSIVTEGKPSGPEDVLVLWNRYQAQASLADSWERAGASVIVCENGYIGTDGHGHQLYAIAVGGHNGSGHVPFGSEDRFSALGVDVHPWVSRPEGYTLVCGQRGVGSKEMASPDGWHLAAQRKLAGGRVVKVREHPGKDCLKEAASASLEADLAGAHSVAIWSSSAGVKALVAGIPVAFDAPSWICQRAAMRGVETLKHTTITDDVARKAALHDMAHAQWTVAEIQSGEPFARILEDMKVAA